MEGGWEHDEQEMDDVTVSKFEALVDQCFEERAVIDEKNAELKALKFALAEKQEKIMTYLEQFDKTKHSGRMGSISIRIDAYPAMPKDPEKKAAFFSYLKERDIFESMVSVNSQTLKGYYKQEVEAHAEDPNFAIPGLEPFEKKTLYMRKSK